MKNIGILRPDALISLLNGIGVPSALAYSFSMFVFPFIDSHGEWAHVQNVWDRWQSLNVGMLAFIASITAFNISRYNANKQRERDFRASKAFLPAALSELTSYLESCALVLSQGWESQRREGEALRAPDLPKEYKEIFSECIRHAEPAVGEYLSQILVKLQVHDSRLRSFVDEFNDPDHTDPDKYSLIAYLYGIGEMQALVNNLFNFARNETPFDESPLDWRDFRTAYANLGLPVDKFYVSETMNLQSFTKRAIEKKG